MKKEQFIKVDSRNRVCLTKLSKNTPELYRGYEIEDGTIILKPVREIPEEERWLFEPENRGILEEVKKGS